MNMVTFLGTVVVPFIIRAGVHTSFLSTVAAGNDGKVTSVPAGKTPISGGGRETTRTP